MEKFSKIIKNHVFYHFMERGVKQVYISRFWPKSIDPNITFWGK